MEPSSSAPLALARSRRQRRADKLEALRRTLAALERALPVALTLDAVDDNVHWDGFLDDQALRVRSLMRKQIALAQEAKRLAAMRARLQDLLLEQRVAARVLAGLMRENPAEASKFDFKRWSELARTLYIPWTMGQCQGEMEAALKAVNAFRWSQDKVRTGVSILGWRCEQRIDDLRGVFQLQSHKTFRDSYMMRYIDIAWRAYTHRETYQEVIVGHRMIGDVEVLQQLEPSVVIVRSVERIPAIDVDAHLVNLVFRVETERGFTQCVRSICCPELMKAIDGPRDVWPTNFVWLQWERLERDADAYDVRMGGTLSSKDVGYAQQWMLEAFGCILRSEQLATGTKLITGA